MDESYALRSDSLTNIADWRSILTVVVFFLSSKSRRIDAPSFKVAFGASLTRKAIRHYCHLSISHSTPKGHCIRFSRCASVVKFRIFPRTSEPLRRAYLPVNSLSGPLLVVLLLLATRAINGVVLRYGILGANGVQPLNIMALFISLVRGQSVIDRVI